jgi:hypothetical protein
MVHHRHSIRLKGYDYTSAYFPISHDAWIIMINHIHGIIWINDPLTCRGEAFGKNAPGIFENLSPNASPQG